MVDLPDNMIDLPDTTVDHPDTMLDLSAAMVDLPDTKFDLPDTMIGLHDTMLDLPDYILLFLPLLKEVWKASRPALLSYREKELTGTGMSAYRPCLLLPKVPK